MCMQTAESPLWIFAVPNSSCNFMYVTTANVHHCYVPSINCTSLSSVNLTELPVIPFRFIGSLWLLPTGTFCDDFECPAKWSALPQHIQALFLHHCQQLHSNSLIAFTDGSKDDSLVGCAAILEGQNHLTKLPSDALSSQPNSLALYQLLNSSLTRTRLPLPSLQTPKVPSKPFIIMTQLTP